jgi:hypothetical protein
MALLKPLELRIQKSWDEQDLRGEDFHRWPNGDCLDTV